LYLVVDLLLEVAVLGLSEEWQAADQY